jgi:rhamnosyltransferase
MTSIIIPTYNAEEQICRLFQKLQSQTVSSEIIVVDSSSSDRTAEIAESSGAKVLVVRKEDFDHGGTRNHAARSAAGDILILLTQDVLPVDEYSIERLVRPFAQNGGIGACYGRQFPYPEASSFAAFPRFFNYPGESCIIGLEDRRKYGMKTFFLSNSFAAYRREALKDIGWFREGLIMGEDACAAAGMLKAGYRIAYASDAQVYHSHEYTTAEELKRYFDIGVFHKSEPWLLKEFGKAESEGKKFMQAGLAFLAGKREYHLMPEFLFRNIFKYIAYKLGKNYDKLPDRIVDKMSMHRNFWKNRRDVPPDCS